MRWLSILLMAGLFILKAGSTSFACGGVGCLFGAKVHAEEEKSSLKVGVKEVELGIDGLSCPFCVVGLRKQVERIETIENLDISLKEAIARITLKEKTILNIEDYKEAVRKSGFSVREIKIMAEGEIITYGDFLALKVTGTNQIFILSDTKELKAGAKVLIKGKVHEHQEGRPYGLSIEQVENR